MSPSLAIAGSQNVHALIVALLLLPSFLLILILIILDADDFEFGVALGQFEPDALAQPCVA